jgi:stalled ribosome rescue protein Dom34
MGQSKVTLIKRQFDSQHVRRLKEAAAEGKNGQVLVICMEEGIAHLFIVSG